METAIVSGIIKEIVTSLGTFAYNEIVRVLGVKDEIEKLDKSLESIRHEIRNADQTIAHSEATNEQLKKLIDIAYEAESIIDRFRIEMNIRTSQLQQVTNQTTESQENSVCRRLMLLFQGWRHSSICREVGTRYQAANDIERLSSRLEEMRAQRNLIQLLQALAARHQAGASSSQIGPSHDVAGLIGSVITNSCNNLVRSLRTNGGNSEALFAIVGAPGVGKTALAQKIYHEMRDDAQTTRMWVYIPGGASDRLTIWIGDVLDDEAASAENLEQQKDIIHRRLNGSGLLLVVDNVRDEDGWEFLGAQRQGFLDRSVRVLVTTPSRDIARRIGINVWSYCHHVSPLDEDDGWQLLCREAHLNERTAVGNVQDAGRRIVHQCSGLPLALKAVGSNLRSRNRADQWERELDNNFIVKYKVVRRSIDASYMDLGYRLKRCFLYCALYPEGYVIEQRHIVQQWIAEGFFQGMERTGNRRPPEPEEEARKCYKELVKRSLLLPTENNGADRGATMPALLRSYAIYRSQDENCTGDPTPIGRAFKAWRLSVPDASAVHNIPDDVTSLRTFMVLGTQTNTAPSTTPSSLMDAICRKFTGLRVLDLRKTQVVAVSSYLEILVQLRYLNLSNTSITTLPPQVGKLVVLQFLILKNCHHLTSLPEEIGSLKDLRSLDISGTQDVHFRFSLNNLKDVNCFGGFVPVGGACASSQGSNNYGWTFSELSNLSKLTSLQILKLGRSISRQEASQLRLHDKTHLKELELWCTPVDWRSDIGDAEDDPQGLSTGSHFLDALKPPQHVATLKLAQFPGSKLPSWVSASHLTQLQRLTLDGCSHCRRLPSLGEMTHLKFLAFTGPNAMLSELGSELRGAPREGVAFPRLEQLIVARMENLETWGGLEDSDMPLLQSFHISRCPKLRELPLWLQYCTALTSLKVHHAREILVIDNLPALRELEVGICRSLHRISNLVRLQVLKVNDCPDLRAVQSLPLLRNVRLIEHREQLPQWLMEQQQLLLPLRLRRLEIVGSEGLLYRCMLPPYRAFIQDAADHVYAEHNGSVYFSYTKTTPGGFILSQQCIQRGRMYGPVAVRVNPQIIQGNREPWMPRWLYTICAAVLIAIQVQFFLLYIF